MNRVKILFLSGFRLLEDKGHLMYFTYNLLILHLAYYTYNFFIHIQSSFSLYNGHREVPCALSLSVSVSVSHMYMYMYMIHIDLSAISTNVIFYTFSNLLQLVASTFF